MSTLKKWRNFTGIIFVVVVLVVFSTGCAGPTVFNPTLMPHFDKPILARIVMADATYDKNVVIEQYKPLFAAVERSLREDMEKTNLMSNLVFERNMSPKGYGIPGRTVYLLRYRATDYKQLTESRCCCGSEHPGYQFITTIWMTFDMRIYDVTHATILKTKETTTEEYLNVYDTSELRPLRKETYKVKVVGSQGNATGEEIIEWNRSMAADLARQLIRDSAHAIQETLATSH